MNATQIDHLLQVTAARPEPVGGSGRGREIGPPFDNHFRAARERGSAFEPPSPASPDNQRLAEKRPTAAPAEETPREASTTHGPTSKSNPRADGEDDTTIGSAGKESDGRHPLVSAEGASDDESNAEHEESVEVAALLAAEQADPVASAEGRAGASTLQAEADESIDPTAKIDSTAAAEPAGQVKSTADGASAADVSPAAPTVAAVQDETSAKRNAEIRQSKLTEGSLASQDAASELEPAHESIDEANSDSADASKHHRQPEGGNRAGNQAAVQQVTDEPTAKISAAAGASEQVASQALSRNSSARSQKKSGARSAAAPPDAQAPSAERPAAVAQVSESAAGAPVAASVEQRPSANVTTEASPAAAKPVAGPKEAKPGMLSSLAQLDRGAASSSRGGHRPGQAESTPVVDPARFVSRVARAVQTAHERGGPLQLRLSPPELGALRLELSIDRGALTAKIETENSNARQVLLDNLPALRDRLADQNVKIERFDVDVRRDPSGDSQNYAPQDRDQQQRQQSAGGNRTSPTRHAPAPLVDDPPPVRRTISSTSINVVA